MNSLRDLLRLIWLLIIIYTLTIRVQSIPTSAIRCQYPYQQIYSNKAGKCLSLVGGTCTPGQNDAPENITDFHEITEDIGKKLNELEDLSLFAECIAGAVCFKDGLFGYCVCASGLLSTSDRKCSLDFGVSCHSSSEIQCDKHKLLACVDGQCKCKNPMHEYDLISEQCVGKVGALCNERYYPNFGDSSHRHRDDENLEHNVLCTAGANCYSINPKTRERFGNGVCRCDGFSSYETINRTCKIREWAPPPGHPRSVDDVNGSGRDKETFLIVTFVVIAVLIIISLFIKFGVK